MTRALPIMALAAILAVPCLAAAAPLQACTAPARIAPARSAPPPPAEIVRDVPIAAYMLALTWSPEWCRTRHNAPDAQFQCRQNHLGFVVHGLWPNGRGKRHPRYCAPAPALSAATVRKHYCMTPSADLQQHEWAAHGACGWRTPEAYFDRAQALWAAIDAPDLAFPPGRTVTAGDVRDAFLARNPRLRRSGIFLKVGDGNRLMEARLCYDLQFRPAACPGGLGAPDQARIRVQH
ncbi:ribonuclease T2 family protein [Phenylobacterium sp.]|uniref:ribonuclease T2 family protein n=1 Tax=Phenylobacterium sp. TaxID=1871053 RepID=UPI00289C2459|nr:ribonuclease T [Phenylobacterium sp.]